MSTTIRNIYNTISLEIGNDGEDIELTSATRLGNLFNKVAFIEALKAEGVLDAVEIITELPEVEEGRSGSLYVNGLAFGTSSDFADGSKHRAAALRSLALARYCEAKYAEKAAGDEAAEAALAGHRKRIVNRHASGLGAHAYDDLDANGKYIVDTIRELEDSLAAK